MAAVIERSGRFLMVEEAQPEGRVFNQPAGHLEPNESLIDAAVREVREETGYHFVPRAVVGLYRWYHPNRDLTFLRLAFAGEAQSLDDGPARDPEIIAVHWLSRAALAERSDHLRSPLVMRSINDHLTGTHYELDLIRELNP